MQVVEDLSGKYWYIITWDNTGKRHVMNVSSRPMPVFRWIGMDRTVTTFTVSGYGFFSIEHKTSDKGENIETKLAVAIDGVQKVYENGLENYRWEGWNTSENCWEEQKRPHRLEYNGENFELKPWTNPWQDN